MLPERVVRWVHDARQQFRLHLFSNNPSRRRIEAVANSFELPYTAGAGKPRRGPLRQVLEQLQLPAQQVALIGDRVFTDVLAGNRWDCSPCWCTPLGPVVRPQTTTGCSAANAPWRAGAVHAWTALCPSDAAHPGGQGGHQPAEGW